MDSFTLVDAAVALVIIVSAILAEPRSTVIAEGGGFAQGADAIVARLEVAENALRERKRRTCGGRLDHVVVRACGRRERDPSGRGGDQASRENHRDVLAPLPQR